MPEISVTSGFIRLLVIIGSIVLTPLLMIAGVIAFPLIIYSAIYSWCTNNVIEEFEDEEYEDYYDYEE